jgi:hypothetical protein
MTLCKDFHARTYTRMLHLKGKVSEDMRACGNEGMKQK